MTSTNSDIDVDDNGQTDTPAPRVYLDYDQQQLDAQYDQSTLVNNVEPYERAWQKGSSAARDKLNARRDLSYGDSDNEKLDLFLPAGEGPFPVVAFFHGGGWTRHNKEKFSFPAPAFVEHDIAYACVGFDRMPKVKLRTMVEQSRRAVDWLLANATELNIDADALFVAGHSSGAHLAASTLTIDNDDSAPDVKGALLISGVYDFEPMRLSARNNAFKFSKKSARELSPIAHIPTDPCPLVIACGGAELDEFQRQSSAFAQAWDQGGGEAQFIKYERHNHFSMTEELADATGEAMQAFLALIEQPL